VTSQTGNVYDGDGRVVRKIAYSYATELWETGTSYGGDYTTVTPPSGGTATTTYLNGLGKTSYIYQYRGSSPPLSPPAPGSGASPGSSGWDQTAYSYTPAGQLAGIADAAGSTWSYSYDLAGNQVSISDPDTGTTASSYDPAGRLVSVTDARGKTISYSYDQDGRKTAAYDTTGGGLEAGGTQIAGWTYDTLAKGQLTSSVTYGSGGTSGTSYTEAVTGCNALGLPQGQTVSVSAGPLTGSYKESYGYDPYTGEMTGTTLPAGGRLLQENVSTGYDTANRPVSLGGSTAIVSGLSYTELGQPQRYALGGGPTATWIQNTWDLGTGRLSSSEVQAGAANPVTLDATSYSYDNAGLVTSAADTPSGGPAQVQCNDYDYLGRLAQAWSQASADCTAGPSQSAESGAAAPYWDQYSYNQQNALTSQTSVASGGASSTASYSYPAPAAAQPHAPASQQVTGPSGSTTATYSYDSAGHSTGVSGGSPGNQSLSWDDAGRLGSLTGPAGTTSYVYDASGSLLLQSDPGSTTLYLPGEQLTQDTGTGTVTGVRYYSIGGTAVAALSTGGHLSWLAGNQQGTANVAIDTSSLAPAYRYYDPYGNQIGAAPSSWPGTRGFVGGTSDPATGLVNLGAREYQPGTASHLDRQAGSVEPESIPNWRVHTHRQRNSACRNSRIVTIKRSRARATTRSEA
jgi:YD repeat-containing protein